MFLYPPTLPPLDSYPHPMTTPPATPPTPHAPPHHEPHPLYGAALTAAPLLTAGALYLGLSRMGRDMISPMKRPLMAAGGLALGAGALGLGGLGYLGYRGLKSISEPERDNRGAPVPYPPQQMQPYTQQAMLPLQKLSFEKRALLSGALRSFGSYAARNPEDALALTHALDESLKGAVRGGVVGGVGGYLMADPGQEEDLALRGALLGAGAGAIHRGATRGMEAADALATPRGKLLAARRLQQLSSGGRALSEALDY